MKEGVIKSSTVKGSINSQYAEKDLNALQS